MQIEKLARKSVVTVRSETPVREVTGTMFDRSIGSVVVVENNDLVGIVTDQDLVVELLAADGPANLFVNDVDPTEITAADVMTADPLVVQTGDELPRVLHHIWTRLTPGAFRSSMKTEHSRLSSRSTT